MLFGSIFDRNNIGLITRTLDNPSAGANLYWKSPENTRILVIAINFTLATSAAVATRRATVQALQGSTPFAEAPAPGDQIASLTWTYHFAPCILGIDGGTDHSTQWASLSPNLFLDPDHALATAISNIDATDQLSAITIRYYQTMPR